MSARSTARCFGAALVLVTIHAADAQSQPCGPRWLPAEPPPLSSLSSTDVALSNGDLIQGQRRWSDAARTLTPFPFAPAATPANARPVELRSGDIFAIGTFVDTGGATSLSGFVFRQSTQTWQRFGTPITFVGYPVCCPANSFYGASEFPNGDILVHAVAVEQNPFPVRRVWLTRWSVAQQQWVAINEGLLGRIESTPFVLPSGEVLAAGLFPSSPGYEGLQVGRWSPQTNAWTLIPGRVNNGAVYGVGAAGSRVLITGPFTHVAGVESRYFSQWDGTRWRAANPSSGGQAYPGLIEGERDGNLLLGVIMDGSVAGGPAPRVVYRFDAQTGGFTFAASAEGYFEGLIFAATYVPGRAGEVYAVANSINGGNSILRRWTATGSSALGRGVSFDPSIAVPLADGRLLLPGVSLSIWDPASGRLTPVSPSAPSAQFLSLGIDGTVAFASGLNIVRFDPRANSLTTLGLGVNNPGIRAVLNHPSGDVYIGGDVFAVAGLGVNRIARWDNALQRWTNLDSGLLYAGASDPALSTLYAMDVYVDGDVLVAGQFSRAGPFAAAGLARWDVQTQRWQSFGEPPLVSQGSLNRFEGVVALPNGDVFVVGNFVVPGTSIAGVARWSNAAQAWRPLTGLPFIPRSIVRRSNGDIVATSNVSTSRPHRYDPTTDTWSPLIPDVLLTPPPGSPAGTMWSPTSVFRLPTGEYVAGGSFSALPDLRTTKLAIGTLTNVPTIARQPISAIAAPSGSINLSATATIGYTNLTALWQLETARGSNQFVALLPGPVPGSAAVATVTPPTPISPFDPGVTTLLLAGVDASLTGRRVRVVIQNDCGSATSNPAILTVLPTTCYADCDADGTLSPADTACFLTSYRTGSPYADCDGSGALTPADFSCFLAQYRAGCP